MALTGCVNKKFRTGEPAYGFVAADEPTAATIGRDILAAYGTAGDAAAAMAMVMTATLPSRVGIGGGGACLLFDPRTKQARTLDFLPRGSGSTAVPSFLRSIYALHALTGKLRWEQIAVEAERLAYSNPSVSRVFAQDLAAYGSRLEGEARRTLLPGGVAPTEGKPLAQPELGNLLSQIRRQGVTPVYMGSGAATLAEGLGIDAGTLRAYQTQWRGTVSVPRYPYDLQFAELPEGPSGTALAAAWKAGEAAPAGERVGRALAALGAGTATTAEPPAAGFVVVDGQEMGVACTFTLGAPFGTGRVVPGTGMLGAVPVRSAGFGAPSLLTNSIVGRTIFGAAGVAAGTDGAAAGPAATIAAALPALLDNRPAQAILADRPADMPGRVSLMTCQLNTENLSKDCQVSGDPRAPGVGYVVETDKLPE